MLDEKLIKDELRELLTRPDIRASWSEYISSEDYFGSDETNYTRDTTASRFEYNDYINSGRWFQKRKERLDHDKHVCVICQSEAKNVHHIRYPNIPEQFGDEIIADLASLCLSCHEFITFWENWYKSEKQELVNYWSPARTYAPTNLTNLERIVVYEIARRHLCKLTR